MYDCTPPKATVDDWLEFESWPEDQQRLVERVFGKRLLDTTQNYRNRFSTNISSLGHGHTS